MTITVKTMYRAKCSTWEPEIVAVQVTKETPNFVFIKDGKYDGSYKVAKAGRSESYHDTWEEAHRVLVNWSSERVAIAEERVIEAHAIRDKITAMKPPAEVAP